MKRTGVTEGRSPSIVKGAAAVTAPVSPTVIKDANSAAGGARALEPTRMKPSVSPSPLSTDAPSLSQRPQPTRLAFEPGAQPPSTPPVISKNRAAELDFSVSLTAGEKSPKPLPPASQIQEKSMAQLQRKPSSLRGAPTLPFSATSQEIQQLFPAAQADVVRQVVLDISSAPLPAAPGLRWIRFGEAAQDSLAQLVKQRLQLADAQPLRLVPLLLRQLHGKMADILEALQGGVFKRSVARVWSEVAPEITLLEEQLRQSLPALASMSERWVELGEKTQAIQVKLCSLDMAATYLLDKVSAEVQPVLGTRSAAILASQALALEQLQLLEVDRRNLQELTVLVQDGILLKLPAVFAQLGQLHQALNGTQRLLLSELVLEFKAYIERKIKP